MIGQKMLPQDSARESSPLLKLDGSTHVHCEILQLRQARSMVLTEVKEAFERFSKCLALIVGMCECSNYARSLTDTKARPAHSVQS